MIKTNNYDKPSCVGIGLVSLDIVINGDTLETPQYYAGGSCGNVLTILAYLGWNTYPIVRLSNNETTKILLKDLKRWKVKTSLISQTPDGSTPIILHRIFNKVTGEPKHRFEFIDPNTGKWFPRFKPLLSQSVPLITKKIPESKVFYFDRLSRSSVDLLKHYKRNGALTFFEPSSISDYNLFNESIPFIDIIKFSSDRIHNYEDLYPTQQIYLEIKTIGSDGLLYRYGNKKKARSWKKVPAHQIKMVKDTAGAGDWCSAGIIYYLFENYPNRSILDFSNTDLEQSLRFGQMLGALNCMFVGARGLMYCIKKNNLFTMIGSPDLCHLTIAKMFSHFDCL